MLKRKRKLERAIPELGIEINNDCAITHNCVVVYSLTTCFNMCRSSSGKNPAIKI
jgi:hypothetical protein